MASLKIETPIETYARYRGVTIAAVCTAAGVTEEQFQNEMNKGRSIAFGNCGMSPERDAYWRGIIDTLAGGPLA